MVVASPKPRLVKLVITRAGVERLSAGRNAYKMTRYNVKIEIGGIAGVVAPLIGKQPKDASVWILGGDGAGSVARAPALPGRASLASSRGAELPSIESAIDD
jgi:hypothetical protein